MAVKAAGRRGSAALLSPARPARPACFDSDEDFAIWQELAYISKTYDPRNYCLDCTPEYKARMESEGRCAHPEVEFKPVHAGTETEIAGFRGEKWKRHTTRA